jgi:hypothetical protein
MVFTSRMLNVCVLVQVTRVDAYNLTTSLPPRLRKVWFAAAAAAALLSTLSSCCQDMSVLCARRRAVVSLTWRFYRVCSSFDQQLCCCCCCYSCRACRWLQAYAQQFTPRVGRLVVHHPSHHHQGTGSWKGLTVIKVILGLQTAQPIQETSTFWTSWCSACLNNTVCKCPVCSEQ